MKNKKSKSKKNVYLSFSVILIILIGFLLLWFFFFSKNSLDKNDNQNNASNNTQTSLHSYVRPPVAAKFNLNNTNQNFVVSYSHFDSPGASSSNGETSNLVPNQGDQEVNEAKYIDEVLKTFEQYYGEDDVFFMGDTNIKVGNQSKAFNVENIGNISDKNSDKKYNFVFEDSKAYSTSLSSNVNQFANPYDKIICGLNDFAIDNNYSDISEVLKENISNGFIINTYKTLPTFTYDTVTYSGAGWIKEERKWWQAQENGQDKYNESQLFQRYVQYGVSDHLPVGLNIKTSESDETLRIGLWNVLNFSFLDKEINGDVSSDSTNSSQAKSNAHARNVADIISSAKYDLIGLIEINKDTSITNFKYFLNYLNSKNNGNKYEGFLTNNTHSEVGSSGQVEQVAFIYNVNKINLITSIKPYFYGDAENTNAILDIITFNLFIQTNNLYYKNIY